jgi:hypothetical protein
VQADEYTHNAAYNLLDAPRRVGVQHERQDRRRFAPLGAGQTVRRRRRQVHQRAGNFRYHTEVRAKKAALRIRIRTDPKLLVGSGYEMNV